MSSFNEEKKTFEFMKDIIFIVDVMLPDEEAKILHRFKDEIILYVENALLAGLSLEEILQDLESVEGLWGFGPWGAHIEEQRLFLIANSLKCDSPYTV